MRLFLTMIMLVLPLASFAHAPGEVASGAVDYALNKGGYPKDYPLELVADMKQFDLGKLMDFEIRPLPFSLRNKTDKPVVVKRLLSGCPCLELARQYHGVSIPAGGELKVEAKIWGKKLNAGEFRRAFILELEGFPVTYVRTWGERVDMMDYNPNQIIMTGSFSGTFPWRRVFVLTHRFDAPGVELSLPEEEHPIFKLKLSKKGEKEYELEVAPKLPLKVGKMNGVIEVAVKGVPNYGPIEVGVFGTVVPESFHLSNSRQVVVRQKLKDDEEYVLEVPVNFGKELSARERARGGRRRLSHRERDQRVFLQDLSVDERAYRPLDKKETWEYFAKRIKVGNVPPGARLDVVPEADKMVLKMTFPKGYFKTNKDCRRLLSPVTYEGKRIGFMEILVR